MEKKRKNETEIVILYSMVLRVMGFSETVVADLSFVSLRLKYFPEGLIQLDFGMHYFMDFAIL